MLYVESKLKVGTLVEQFCSLVGDQLLVISCYMTKTMSVDLKCSTSSRFNIVRIVIKYASEKSNQ